MKDETIGMTMSQLTNLFNDLGVRGELVFSKEVPNLSVIVIVNASLRGKIDAIIEGGK